MKRNIRFKFSDLKNIYQKFLDGDSVICDTCNEDAPAPGSIVQRVDCAGNQRTGRVHPEWETKNICFKDWRVIDSIYRQIVKMGERHEGPEPGITSVIRKKLLDQLLEKLEQIRDVVTFNANRHRLEYDGEEARSDAEEAAERVETQRNESPSLRARFDEDRTGNSMTGRVRNDAQHPPQHPILDSKHEYSTPKTEKKMIQNNCQNPMPSEPAPPETRGQTTLDPNLISFQNIKKPLLKSYTFINCDVNYFNFKYLVSRVGSFDVVMMDPPWRIKGGQKNDSQFMFANNRFCLEYDTMSNDQIAMLDIGALSEKGFMFLWILGNQINMACKMLNKWGYDLVDLIIWVKTKRGKVYLSHGYYLMHSYEICLVGYKCPAGSHVEYFSKVSNNIIFSEVRGKSQKPDAIYEIIEMMMPGAKKLEIFARNNNLRQGWFSLGNQLGEEFHQWSNHVNCDQCSRPISIGTKRYKSKTRPNFDICQKCFRRGNKARPKPSQNVPENAPNPLRQPPSLARTPASNQATSETYNKNDFFELNNLVSETVLHKYYSCNNCQMNPIWGLRFSCLDCPNFDLCEGCFDKQLRDSTPETDEGLVRKRSGAGHPPGHRFEVVEMQKLSLGFQTHLGEKCAGCYQKPIIGVCFKCSSCSNLSLCQKCYFKDKDLEVKNRKTHKQDHNWEFFIRPQKKGAKSTCSWCEEDDAVAEYKCNICFDFGLCALCYIKRANFKINKATTHKAYHGFTRIDVDCN